MCGRATISIKQLQHEIPDFIGPDIWPSDIPDMNPVDYKVWGVTQQRLYECHMNSVDELKLRLIDVLDSLQQNIIDAANDHQRLEKTESMPAYRWITF